MTPPELLSRSPLVTVPGRVAVLVAAIVAWIGLSAGLLVAAAHTPVMALVAGLSLLPVLLAGPVLGGSPLRATIGRDGIATRFLGRERFVSFQDVTGIHVVSPSSGGGVSRPTIEVAVARGPSLWLRPMHVERRHGRRGQIYVDDAIESSAMLQALQAAYAAARAEPRGADDDEATWARRDRSVDRWLADVFAQRTEAADYRAGALDREGLLRVAERPSADPTARAAAAALLQRQQLEPGERERLRVAADATAHPRLRVALEAVAEETCDTTEVERRLRQVARG